MDALSSSSAWWVAVLVVACVGEPSPAAKSQGGSPTGGHSPSANPLPNRGGASGAGGTQVTAGTRGSGGEKDRDADGLPDVGAATGGSPYQLTDGGVIEINGVPSIQLDTSCPSIPGPDLWGGRTIFFPTMFSGCCRYDGQCGGTPFAVLTGVGFHLFQIPGAPLECMSYDDLRALEQSYANAPPPSYPIAPRPHFDAPSGAAPACGYTLGSDGAAGLDAHVSGG